MDILKWYMNRMGIYQDCYHDLRFLLTLRANSDPAETLMKVKERLDQTMKELEDESQKETETE